jgi:hypothetical protein
VSTPNTKTGIPSRAITSVVFACFSLFLFRVYGQVHWLPTRFLKDGRDIFDQMLSQVDLIRDQLDIAYRALTVRWIDELFDESIVSGLAYDVAWNISRPESEVVPVPRCVFHNSAALPFLVGDFLFPFPTQLLLAS